MSCHKIRLILKANKVKAETIITNTKKNENYIILYKNTVNPFEAGNHKPNIFIRKHNYQACQLGFTRYIFI